MPDKTPLELPPDDPDAIADLVRGVAGAGRCLGSVDERLIGAGSAAPGWLGDDGAAAAAQVGAVAALVGAAADSVRRAAGRLDAHADQVREIRRQVAALQDEQDDQFREAWNRWARVENLQLQIMVGGPEVRAIIDEVDAGEASRRRRHHALLEELADDAAATARILAEASAVVGGRGVRGDANRVVAYLAAELPGWGDLELARRGREWADQLGQWLDPSHRDALAQEVLPLAGSAAFAGAFLQALGVVWMRDLLQSLGEGDYGPNSALARTVALSLGVASRDGVRSAPVAEVLGAKYVSADDLNGLDDLAVLGMGTVLAASRALGAGGLAPATVAAWGRQIALRERTVGAAAIDRINPLGQQAAPVDALPLVVAILADGEDPASAAEFLSGPSVWNVLLTRSWDDCGLSLGHLTATAGTVEGPAGEAVVRSGLEALGARLADEDSGDWPVHRATANAVTPALADALAAHVSLAGGVLTASVDGELAAADGAMLRGLGFVTLDRHAAAVVEDALASWVAVQPVPAWTVGPPPPLPTVVVPNAYLAVQDYGQRLGFALDEVARKQEADDRAFLWNCTVALVADLAPGPWGIAAGVVEGYVAQWLHLDGTWESGGDHGLTFGPDTPSSADLASLTPEEWTVADRMARMAQASFAGTEHALGHALAPVSSPTHWWGPLLDAVVPGPADLPGLAGHRHPAVSPIR